VCQNGLPEGIRHSPSAPSERLRARKDKTKTVHVTPGSWQITARSKLSEDRADAPTPCFAQRHLSFKRNFL
jgi:hypothetical protein